MTDRPAGEYGKRAGLLLALLSGILLVAGCGYEAGRVLPPRPPETAAPVTCIPAPTAVPSSTPTLTPSPGRTPSPVATRLPTPLASGRIAGKVCLAEADVYARSCCPPWEAVTVSDATGAFAFEALTVGTFTVTCGLHSPVVTLATFDSQVNVDLCPPPTPAP